MSASNASQALVSVADKSLNALETASSSLDSIRIEINRYWDKISLLASVASTQDPRATERDLDSIIEGHERHINVFGRSVSQAYAPAARSLHAAEPTRIPYDKASLSKKRNRKNQSELLNSYEDALDSMSLTAIAVPVRKRRKIFEASVDVSSLERLLGEWVEQTNGDFQIIVRQGQVIVGRNSGQGTSAQSVILPPPAATSSILSSISGSKSYCTNMSMAYGLGQVEVKASIKGVAAFSFLVTPSDRSSSGEVVKVVCSHVAEGATTNVWITHLSGPSTLMNLLTNLLSHWVESNRPSVATFLSHLLTYTDLYKSNCATCGKWLIDDGHFGILPPLYHIPGSTSNARRHFSCSPL